MPTRRVTVNPTTAVHVANVNENRITLTIKNMSGINVDTGTLCRLSRARNVGRGEGYILDDNEILHFTKVDGDHPDKELYARMVSGYGTLCIIEEFGIPPKKGWW